MNPGGAQLLVSMQSHGGHSLWKGTNLLPMYHSLKVTH